MLRVNGGPTGAGTRIVRERTQDWDHRCDGRPVVVRLAAAYMRCPACGAKRP